MITFCPISHFKMALLFRSSNAIKLLLFSFYLLINFTNKIIGLTPKPTKIHLLISVKLQECFLQMLMADRKVLINQKRVDQCEKTPLPSFPCLYVIRIEREKYKQTKHAIRIERENYKQTKHVIRIVSEKNMS